MSWDPDVNIRSTEHRGGDLVLEQGPPSSMGARVC